MPALRELGPDRFLQAAKEAALGGNSSGSKWDLKGHPLVVLTSAVMATVGITWKFVDTTVVKPQNSTDRAAEGGRCFSSKAGRPRPG
jgi:hypothetical protein